MRAGIVVNVTPGDRRRLEAIVGNRNAPQKHVWRAKIILATDEGCGTAEIMRRSGKAKPVVWRWQARFMAEGVAGLTRDKTRKPGKPPLPVATVRRVVDLAVIRVHFERAAPKRHFGRSTKGSLCGGQARCRKSITRTVARRREKMPWSSMRRLLQLRDASHFLLRVGHDGSRHVEHTHAQFLWFRREPWRCPQNSFRGGRPLLPQPLH